MIAAGMIGTAVLAGVAVVVAIVVAVVVMVIAAVVIAIAVVVVAIVVVFIAIAVVIVAVMVVAVAVVGSGVVARSRILDSCIAGDWRNPRASGLIRKWKWFGCVGRPVERRHYRENSD